MKRFVLTAALAVAGAAAMAQDLTGNYRVNGTNLDGSPYHGEARITATSEYTCEIVWQTGGSSSSGI